MTRRAALLAVLLNAAPGCRPPSASAPPLRDPDELQLEYLRRSNDVKKRAFADMVETECPPKLGFGRCGLLVNTPEFKNAVEAHLTKHCTVDGEVQVTDECRNRAFQRIRKKLAERYPEADAGAVIDQCDAEGCSLQAEELRWMASHNESVVEEARAKLDRIAAEYARERDQLAAEYREREDADARWRERRQAIGAALQAFGSGMSQSGSGAPPTAPAEAGYSGAASGCTSDYQCGVGKQCVKASYQIRGTCMTAVDEYGTRTYSPPRPSSVGPGGPAMCQFDTQCPVGFRCAKGNCVR